MTNFFLTLVILVSAGCILNTINDYVKPAVTSPCVKAVQIPTTPYLLDNSEVQTVRWNPDSTGVEVSHFNTPSPYGSIQQEYWDKCRDIVGVRIEAPKGLQTEIIIYYKNRCAQPKTRVRKH